MIWFWAIVMFVVYLYNPETWVLVSSIIFLSLYLMFARIEEKIDLLEARLEDKFEGEDGLETEWYGH